MATPELLSDDARLILNFIRDYPGVTRMQIAENVRIDRFDIAMAMKQLTKHNAIVRIESEQGHTSGSDTIRLCEIQSNSAMLVYFVGSKD